MITSNLLLIWHPVPRWLTYYGKVDTEVPGGGIDEVYSAPEHPFILYPDVIHLQTCRVHARSLEVRSGSQVIANKRVVRRLQATATSIQTEGKTRQAVPSFTQKLLKISNITPYTSPPRTQFAFVKLHYTGAFRGSSYYVGPTGEYATQARLKYFN